MPVKKRETKSKKKTTVKKATTDKRPLTRGRKKAAPKKSRSRVVKSSVNNPSEELLNESFKIEHLLIDEQLFYSSEIKEELEQAEQSARFEPVLDQLNNQIYGQKPEKIQPTTSGQINISLNNQTAPSDDSLKYFSNPDRIVNLRNQESGPKLIKPAKSVESEFKIQEANFELPAPSFLTRLSLKDKLLSFWKSFSQRSKNFKTKFFKHHKKISVPTDSFWAVRLKMALNFALIALLLIIPVRGLFLYQHVVKTKGRVLGATEIALNEFKEGAKAVSLSDWSEASFNFSQAGSYFMEAQGVLRYYNKSLVDFLSSLPIASRKLKDGQNLLKAGELFSKAATNLSLSLKKLNDSRDLNESLTDTFVELKDDLESTLADLKEALALLEEVDSAILPEEFRDSFEEIRSGLPQVLQSIGETEKIFDFTLSVLGHNSPKRYIFLFQNNNELRPSGGFLGSFALADLNKGKITNLEVPGGGLYDLDGAFFEKIIAPEPFHLLGTPWKIWNANWWPDWPTSAKKLAWFFEKSNWPTTDGLIAINAAIMPQIISLVGNIELPEYNQVLTPDNVVLAIQHEVEFEYDKDENKPKKFIGDLMKIVVEKLLTIQPNQVLPLLLTFNESFAAKDIQFYFSDEALQQTASEFGWTGEMAQTDRDYLMVARANIAGGKTDGVISQQIKHYSYVQPDGSINDTVAITFTHNGDPQDVFERVQNNSFIRVYAPQGSQLLEVSGYDVIDPTLFKEVYTGYGPDKDLLKISGQTVTDPKTNTKINQELGKTVFGNWVQLVPGESQTLTFSYRLPFSLNFETDNFLDKFLISLDLKEGGPKDSYSLVVQNQSGAKNTTLESHLYLPDNMIISWSGSSSQESLVKSERQLSFSTELNRDHTYGALISK